MSTDLFLADPASGLWKGTDAPDQTLNVPGGGPQPLSISAISASGDEAGARPATNAIDGDLTTWWNEYGNGAYLQADLGSVLTVGSVELAFLRGDERVQWFDIDLSEDGVTWTRVYHGASSGGTLALQQFFFEPTSARYVRFIGRENSQHNANSVTEMRVWGTHGVDTKPAAPFTEVQTATAEIAVMWEPGYGPMPLSWEVQKGNSSTGPWQTIVGPGSALQSWDDNDAVENESYYYKIIPSNADGAGPSTVTGPHQLADPSGGGLVLPGGATLIATTDFSSILTGQITAAKMQNAWDGNVINPDAHMARFEYGAIIANPIDGSGKILEFRHPQKSDAVLPSNPYSTFAWTTYLGSSVTSPGYDEVVMEMVIGWSPTYRFTHPEGHQWGAKLPGLAGAITEYAYLGSCGGYENNRGTGYWSARRMWRNYDGNSVGNICMYLYHVDKTQTCGENRRFSMEPLQVMRWYTLRQHVIASQGTIIEYLDGVEVQRRTGLRLDANSIDRVVGAFYHGGATETWLHDDDGRTYLKRMSLWVP